MKTLSAALLIELGLTVTRPGYLVAIGFSTPLYLSTMGDISWNGFTWLGYDVKVSGLSHDGKGGSSGSLKLGNTDNAFGALVLGEGIADKAVNIYAVYAGATATGDVVQQFSGVADSADIAPDFVTIALLAQNNSTLYSPRQFINKASGFNFLQPAGTKIHFGNEIFVLERK